MLLVPQTLPLNTTQAFEPDTMKSLGYLSVSVILTSLCVFGGVSALQAGVPTDTFLSLPFWSLYAAVTGTVGMGNWVLAHECGHGAFSRNKALQTAVGYTIHSLLLVPYFSWQRSHAVHHQFTNHLELGETHVPERGEGGEGQRGAKDEEGHEDRSDVASSTRFVNLSIYISHGR